MHRPQNTRESYCRLKSFRMYLSLLRCGERQRGFSLSTFVSRAEVLRRGGKDPNSWSACNGFGFGFFPVHHCAANPTALQYFTCWQGCTTSNKQTLSWCGHITSGKPQYLHTQRITGEETCAGQGCSHRAMALGPWPSRQAQACCCAMAAPETSLKGGR